MRCGAATYEKLAQIGIFKSYSRKRTFRKIFYPKKIAQKIGTQSQKKWLGSNATSRRRLPPLGTALIK
jgi:hypothetical protein